MKSLLLAASATLVLASPAIARVPINRTAAAAPKTKSFELIDPASVQPATVLPPPPASGSPQEKVELAELHALIAAATPARLAQAKTDDVQEDPSIFDDVAGRKLASLPATWALLKAVQDDADRIAGAAKDHFARARPWGVDPTLHNCDAGPTRKPTRSYPSGHASMGYSTGYVLARLMPERAPAILARAADYALSRQYCAAHFPSDTAASQVLGAIIAERVFADSRLARRITVVRAELATR